MRQRVATRHPKQSEPPGQFVLKLQWDWRRCKPTLGTIEIVDVHLLARATIWWDLFGQKLLIAFNKERINELQWECVAATLTLLSKMSGVSGMPQLLLGSPCCSVDVGLCACGARLPSALEDRMPTFLINKLLQVKHINHQLRPLRLFGA